MGEDRVGELLDHRLQRSLLEEDPFEIAAGARGVTIVRDGVAAHPHESVEGWMRHAST